MRAPSLDAVRFYAILDTGYINPARLEEFGRAVLAGGAGLVQLRAKTATTAERVRWLHVLAPLCGAAGAVLICNDDFEAALAVPGVGLHVGQDDLPVPAARAALGPERVLGLSTHSLAQAQGALAATGLLNYFAVGPVFATQTKPDYQAVGLDLVRAVAALRPPLPWFCIGGINRRNVAQVRHAGACAVVAVSDVLCAADPAGVVRELKSALASEAQSS